MKNLKRILPLLMVILFAGSLIAADPSAIVIKAKGDITIKNAKTGKSLKAKRGTRLTDGDKITTGKKGRMALKFIDDNSLVRVRPNSTLTINTKKEKSSVTKNIFVEVGSIFSRITKQKSSFRVTTPTSVASVKGTAFWTLQKFKGGTTYFGEEGVVELTNDAGSALLKAGETGSVTSKNSKPVVRKTKAGEKPSDGDDDVPDDFEFEFEDESGNKKVLKFKAK
ncbi:MAG: hypothetical protein D8M58_10635 [Calditrichaeota bacterium]|nr:MAG: hypothetical protein DWQ03_10010 [Calditrichota bacterium]MBL1205847.1 hypothetical protein [Calditrichota bacterium]NOG45674.1 FecR domain-containing protein [Calditrichota bacterium]